MLPILTKTNYFWTLIIGLALSSCISDNGEVYNSLSDLSKGLPKDSTLTYEFEIKDTTKTYDIDLLVRHDINYPYYNLYLDCELGTDSLLNYKKVRELFLFDPTTGNPEGFNTFLTGKSLGGLYDHKFPLFGEIKFSETGIYRISLKNYMREDKPIDIHAIGLSLRTDN